MPCLPVRTATMTIQQLAPPIVHRRFVRLTSTWPMAALFPIPHPDFLSMSPTGRTVIIYQENDDFSILDLLLMTEIEMAQNVTSQT